MTAKELTIDIQANICVSEETACRCLRILEFYLDDNKNKRIVAKESEDGKTSFRIEKIWG